MRLNKYVKKVLKELPLDVEVWFEISIDPLDGVITVSDTEKANTISFLITNYGPLDFRKELDNAD